MPTNSLCVATAPTSVPSDFINVICHHFAENNIEYFRAPYLAWPQLSYFLEKEQPFIHAIYAAEEQMMFNVSRLILDINFANETFSFVDKKQILTQAGNISESQFLDTCILSGSFFGKTHFAISEAQQSLKKRSVFISMSHIYTLTPLKLTLALSCVGYGVTQ